jgi:hypothetical protein
MSLAFINYQKTAIGAYQEFIVLYPVQSIESEISPKSNLDFILKSFFTKNPIANIKFGYLIERLILDSSDRLALENATLAGREVYGLDKSYGKLSFDFHSMFSKGFSVNDGRGLIVNADIKSVVWNFTSIIPLHTDLRLIGNMQNAILVKADQNSFIGLPKKIRADSVIVTAHGESKNLFDRLNFRADTAIYSHHLNFSFGELNKNTFLIRN